MISVHSVDIIVVIYGQLKRKVFDYLVKYFIMTQNVVMSLMVI